MEREQALEKDNDIIQVPPGPDQDDLQGGQEEVLIGGDVEQNERQDDPEFNGKKGVDEAKQIQEAAVEAEEEEAEPAEIEEEEEQEEEEEEEEQKKPPSTTTTTTTKTTRKKKTTAARPKMVAGNSKADCLLATKPIKQADVQVSEPHCVSTDMCRSRNSLRRTHSATRPTLEAGNKDGTSLIKNPSGTVSL